MGTQNLWFYMHTISFNYPHNPNFNDKTNYLNFYNSLKTAIPCENVKIIIVLTCYFLNLPLETRDSLVNGQ